MSQVKVWVRKFNEVQQRNCGLASRQTEWLTASDELTAKRNVYRNLIHSNQGFQYTSIKYHQTAEQLGMIGSHSRKGNCYDNACIESFFSHFKSEYLYLLQDRSEEEIIRAIVSISTFITTNAFKNDSTFWHQ